MTDGPEFRINWLGGDNAELWFAYGCTGHTDMESTVSEAVKALGIGDLPGVY